jgi:hypothetical protein
LKVIRKQPLVPWTIILLFRGTWENVQVIVSKITLTWDDHIIIKREILVLINSPIKDIHPQLWFGAMFYRCFYVMSFYWINLVFLTINLLSLYHYILFLGLRPSLLLYIFFVFLFIIWDIDTWWDCLGVLT